MARDWSRLEVEATVADYFEMLGAELRDEPYVKAEHRRRLQPLLNDRSHGAIERKHQNISAVLLELGYPYIDGYKPLSNYQQLLFDVVAERLSEDARLVRTVAEHVAEPAELPEVEDVLATLEEPPDNSGRDREAVYERVRRTAADKLRGRAAVDYLAMEARNSALGEAGERFVIRFERERLAGSGRGDLSDRVEHVAATIGPAAGFDVRSFEEDGSDRLIEVKTTAYGKNTPFYVTRNELETSRELADAYHLYRAFRFRSTPRLFTVRGSLGDSCLLDPTQYRGIVA